MNEMHLPPYEVQEVEFTNLARELSNWAFRSFRIKELQEHTIGEGVKVCVLDTGCSHKDIQVEKTVDFIGEGQIDYSGHGTWCSGIIGATGNFLGIAPACKLYIGKILDVNGSGSWGYMAKGLEWALDEKCDIVSISAGGGYQGEEIQPLLKELAQRGILVICAAGNENDKLIFPANSPYTIAVGAVNKKWQRASFSNFGPRLIIMAPGVDLLGPYVVNTYGKLSGTSMATPFVSGIAVLERSLDCSLNLEKIIERFRKTSKDIAKPGFDEQTGYGIIAPHKFVTIQAETKRSFWLLSFLVAILLKIGGSKNG